MKYIDKLLQGAEVEWKPLGEISTQISGMSGVSNKWASSGNCRFIDYLNAYKHIKIDIHQLPFATVKKLNQTELRQGDILFTSASETPDECAISSVIEDKISSGIFLDDHLFGIRINEKYKGIIDSSFLNYYFHSPDFRKTVNKAVRGVTRFYISKVAFMRLSIPIPPLSVQRKLVEILDKFTELDCRKRQYEYYRNKLLAFEDRTVIWKSLEEVINPTVNIKWSKAKQSYQYIDLTSVNIDTRTIFATKEITAETAPSRAQKIVLTNDVIFATTRPTQMRIAIVTDDYDNQVASTGYCVLRADDKQVLFKWIYFLLSTNMFRTFLEDNQSGTAYPAISDSKLKEFQIPIPPLSEQQRIVSILDKFDTLTSSISEGLPKEIELRRKQYEYYREQLLSFRH